MIACARFPRRTTRKRSSDRDDHPIGYVEDSTSPTIAGTKTIMLFTPLLVSHKNWIDGEFRVHGPAAKDVTNSFLARWNSDYKPCQSIGDDLLDLDQLARLARSNATSNQCSHNIRAFSCSVRQHVLDPRIRTV
ncbi:hypothetical protein PHYPSEUDO_013133 [Phytophthora pseudosyringae]|uniref:Uncharacterized protein n=1 Tax=Phytophthora pseudosyringae TaxID=221518 RepID=A0A8T1V913_9STRA|nr:hypothetical protein PHYPSEUDO_013133 [Phytophthora pseudosyringae]